LFDQDVDVSAADRVCGVREFADACGVAEVGGDEVRASAGGPDLLHGCIAAVSIAAGDDDVRAQGDESVCCRTSDAAR